MKLSPYSYAAKLAESQDPAVLARLDAVYRVLWPHQAVERVEIVQESAFQRSGRDVRVHLRGPRGTALELTVLETVEEKIRQPGRSSSYQDVLIEYLSNAERGTAGWIYTSQADWLAYVRQPPGVLDVLVLPMPALREWFTPRREQFQDRSAQTRLDNGVLYTTLNKAVPLDNAEFQVFWRAHGCRQYRFPLAPSPLLEARVLSPEEEWALDWQTQFLLDEQRL